MKATKVVRALAGFASDQVGLQHALEEALQQRRHVAEPERIDKHQVLGPFDVLLHAVQRMVLV